MGRKIDKKTEKALRSKYERYEIVEIERKELKNAPYNPRVISERARKALKGNLKDVGLLAPVVWNRRTGNIVAGHQRVAALDALEKTWEYRLTVAAVDLDEKTEMQQNIFMNNSEAQGDFDMEALEKLMKDDALDIEAMGFDQSDVYHLFGEAAMSDENLAELSNKLHQMREGFDKIAAQSMNRDSPHYYLVVIFKDYESRRTFTDTLDLPDNKYVDGRRLLEALRPVEDGATAGARNS
jgi:hypothetical protein